MQSFYPHIVRAGVLLTLLVIGLPTANAAARRPATSSSIPGRIIHLSPDGDDAATGETTTPRRSIQKALDTARPGDVIRLHPGVYREHVAFTHGGASGRPVTLEGTGGAILDASMPFTADWQPAPDIGPGVYATPVSFEVGQVIADGKMVVLLDERRIGGPQKGGGNFPVWLDIFRNGVQNRWDGVGGVAMYRHKEKDLLVRFGDGRNPRKMRIDCAPMGADGVGVLIDGVDRCVVRNIELRNARLGIVVRNSLGSVIERCLIDTTRDGIELGEGSDRCTVRFNTITQSPLGVNNGFNRASPDGQFADPRWKIAWDLWIAHKRYGFYDSCGVLIKRSIGGHRVHDNHIHDHWDGISTRHWENWKSSAAERLALSGFNRGLEIDHNRIERLNDDGLEPNDGGVDQRWHHNHLQHVRCALRLKTIDQGPTYFYANRFKDNGEDIRCYGEQELNPAEIYVYHNSGTAGRALNSNKIFGIGTPNYHFVDNLFWSEAWWGGFRSDAPNWHGDHNVYVRRGDLPLWDTQIAKTKELGIDPHSRWVAAGAVSPYVDADRGDFRLTENSPARGAGVDAKTLATLTGKALPGLDEFENADGTVDAGAIPYGASLPKIPRSPDEVWDEPVAGF